MSELTCKSVCYRDVLHDISLTLPRGKVCALLGPSGAGKSTLLWVLAGLWTPDTGNVSRGEGRLGMVFQQPGLWNHLTVAQHLKIVGADTNQINRTLALMKLDGMRDRKPGTMSGGERQRLSIARALAIEPAWLLLDEPMAHLDGPTRQGLFDLLRNILSETNAGVLIATHHAQEAMRLADQCAVIIDGRIVQHDTPHNVYHHPANPAAANVTGPVTTFNQQTFRPEQLTFTPAPGNPAPGSLGSPGPGHPGAPGSPESTESLDLYGQSNDAVVQGCEFMGDRYLLRIAHADTVTSVVSPQPVAVGTRGRIHETQPPSRSD